MNAVVNWVDLFDVLRAIVIVGAVVLYLAMTAGRLDRLHIRVDAARASLELQLALRAEVVAEVVTDGNVDPVSQQLLTAGLQSRRGHTDQGIHVAPEAEISALLREVVEAHDGVVAGEELQSELRSACNRVEFANRFYNDAVRACRQVRSRRMVRWFRLAGHTPLPEYWEMDDDVPIAGREG